MKISMKAWDKVEKKWLKEFSVTNTGEVISPLTPQRKNITKDVRLVVRIKDE